MQASPYCHDEDGKSVDRGGTDEAWTTEGSAWTPDGGEYVVNKTSNAEALNNPGDAGSRLGIVWRRMQA
jgi:hypothetical protein